MHLTDADSDTMVLTWADPDHCPFYETDLPDLVWILSTMPILGQTVSLASRSGGTTLQTIYTMVGRSDV
jgi:hypothetical protein